MALLEFRCGENRLARNTVHVDTRAGFDIVQVNKAELGDEVDDPMLLGDLHGYREVVGRFRREENVDSLLLEGGIGGLVANLNDMELLRQF